MSGPRLPSGPTPWDARAEHQAVVWGRRIKAARTARGWTTATLAAAIDVPNTTLVSQWEAGRVVPSLARRFAIAAALEVPVDLLFGFADDADERLAEALEAMPAPAPATGHQGRFLRADALAVHYLSTYCLHAAHGDCRLSCKLCGAPCRCPCHGGHR